MIKYLNEIKRKPTKIDLDSIEIIHNDRFHGLLKSIQTLILTYKDSRQFKKKFTLDKIIYKNKNCTQSASFLSSYVREKNHNIRRFRERFQIIY